jgi:hypothetical protein
MQRIDVQDIKAAVEKARQIRDRVAAMDHGKVVTRAVGGAIILTASFLVVANPNAPRDSESSEVVSARIAPIGTVMIAPAPQVSQAL